MTFKLPNGNPLVTFGLAVLLPITVNSFLSGRLNRIILHYALLV